MWELCVYAVAGCVILGIGAWIADRKASEAKVTKMADWLAEGNARPER